MVKNILEDARNILEAEIRRIINKKFPDDVVSEEEKKYNEFMRQRCNLMIGLYSSERAMANRNQVELAIEKFQCAHRQYGQRWAPLNSIAKCYYLLGELDEAMLFNRHALAQTDEDMDRICSHHLLQSQIWLDRDDLDGAQEAILEAISVVPRNVHARKAHLRILSRLRSDSIFDQIEIVQDFPDFPRWANDFITVVDGETDFDFLRNSTEWPQIRREWLKTVEEELAKVEMASVQSTNGSDGSYRRLAKAAALVGIGFAIHIVFDQVVDLVDMSDIFSSSGSATDDILPLESIAGDVEPFAKFNVAGDLEPFLVIAMDTGAVSSLSPLAEAEIWVHDILIG